jgi:short chain dehydrogenase
MGQMEMETDVTDYPLPNISFDLAGQVALVTGATSGLGWRFAEVLAAAGATVVPTGRRRDRLEELTSLIARRGGKAHQSGSMWPTPKPYWKGSPKQRRPSVRSPSP